MRSFDVDAWGEVPPSTLAAYLEQTAWEHSAALGFGPDWYEARGTARLSLRRRLSGPREQHGLPGLVRR
ncbi:MAG: hypothetical protein WCD37_01805, partial [Chloroflexia bacterium]